MACAGDEPETAEVGVLTTTYEKGLSAVHVHLIKLRVSSNGRGGGGGEVKCLTQLKTV